MIGGAKARIARRITFAVAVIIWSPGCYSGGWRESPFDGVSAAPRRISVVVENLIWNDVDIYTQSQGSRSYLGMVVTGQKRTFYVPIHHASARDLTIVADPIGSRHTYDSGRVVALPGQQIRWSVHRSAAMRIPSVW